MIFAILAICYLTISMITYNVIVYLVTRYGDAEYADFQFIGVVSALWAIALVFSPLILAYMITLHVSNYVSELAEKHKYLDKEKAKEKRNDKMTIEVLKDRITKLESQLSDITKKKENV